MAASPPAAGARGQHAAWEQKRIPPVEQVRPGVWSLPTPMPDNPLRYVIAYGIATDDGLALIDSGWLADESWAALRRAVTSIGYDIADVCDVLITHAHYDHHGLTRRLVEASGARVHMHAADAGWLDRLRSTAGDGPSGFAGWLAARGAPAAEIVTLSEQISRSAMSSGFHTQLPPDVLVADGDRPLKSRQELSAVWSPGHTDGHLCYYLEDQRLLFSGDHVLPRITPHVTRPPGEDDDVLGAYLASLRKVRTIHVDEVLPAHEYRFADLAARVDSLLDHHAVRLHEIERAVVGGASTWDVARAISWSRGWDATEGVMRQTALSETYTHLRHLQDAGRVARTLDDPDRWECIEGTSRQDGSEQLAPLTQEDP